MRTQRIDILKGILLDLHQGASPESVQERFAAHFTGVSAIEISLMEQELISEETGITFEDVMQLCDVHANLFKNAVEEVDRPDADRAGHPVKIFKEENLALRAALLRIRRLLQKLPHANAEDREAIHSGLVRQMDLLSQFDCHYRRKEELFFPMMEKYGHTAPPKVMWGVDDQIRELFKLAREAIQDLPNRSFEEVTEAFEAFATEFESMIFKEESILIMLLLEALTQDDWIQIAQESSAYGYAIIRPTEVWVPDRQDFTASPEEGQQDPYTKVIDTPGGQLTLSFKPKAEAPADQKTPQAFGKGYLSVEQANLILNHLPMEITFVNKDDIFQYYNDSVPAEEMIFKRMPSQIGRHVDLCHPPKLLPKVKAIFDGLRSGQRDKFEMWFNSESRGKFVHVTYAAVRDEAGEFQGVLEYVQDIAPYRAIDTEVYRGVE